MAKKDVYDIVSEKYDKRIKREQLIVDADRFKTYDEVFDQQNLDNIYMSLNGSNMKSCVIIKLSMFIGVWLDT